MIRQDQRIIGPAAAPRTEAMLRSPAAIGWTDRRQRPNHHPCLDLLGRRNPDGDHHTLAFFPTCLGGRCLSFSISSGVSCSIPTKELRASLTRISSSIFACSAALSRFCEF